MGGIRIGIFGAAFECSDVLRATAEEIGILLATRNADVVTGATSGAPYFAGKAALAAGGFVLGISPALNPEEHSERFGKPLDGCSQIVWTGCGYTGRNYLNVRNCDAALFLGGELGTLEEFCIAYYEGKVIGVLESSGGICSKVRDLLQVCKTDHGATIHFADCPMKLVNEMFTALESPLPDC